MSGNADRERLVSFSTFLLKIVNSNIGTDPGSSHDDAVEIPNIIGFNNNYSANSVAEDADATLYTP